MILLIDIKNFKPKKADNSEDMEFVCDNRKGMRTILLNDLDELNAITEALKTVTYLETLVQEDFAGEHITKVFDTQTKDVVDMYLLELQTDRVKELDGLIKRVCL